MKDRHLSALPFELAYLALLTRHNIKRLSRWEHELNPEETAVLRELGLRVENIEQRAFLGKAVRQAVFSLRIPPLEAYVKRFDGRRLSSTPRDVRFKGYLFGYPSCCVDAFIRHPYSRNSISRDDQRILFHWACPGCKTTPAMLPYYRDIYRECVKIFGEAPSVERRTRSEATAGPPVFGRALERLAVPTAAMAALLLLPGAVRADDPHWVSVGDDIDGDYLTHAEEMLAGYDWRHAYTTGDSLVDGVHLAHLLNLMIGALPETAQTDQPYKKFVLQYGVETCDICGEVINMGSVHIINPERGLDVEFPIIGLHYLEHGSLSYMGSVHDGRVDLGALKRALLVEDESHYLTYEGDVDGDGLFPEEETYLGSDPADPDTDGDSVKDGPQYFEGLVESLGQLSRVPSEDEPYIVEWDFRGVQTCDICGAVFNMGSLEIVNPAEGLSLMADYVALHYLAHGSAIYEGSVTSGRLLPVLLNTVMHGDGHAHWLEIADDSDGDGLKDAEESHFGMLPGEYDTDGNGIPDGPQLATAMQSIIAGLPEGENPDSTYVLNHYMNGIYPCLICGQAVNMGFMEIVNPNNKSSVFLPYYNLHFMEHGSFETDRPDLYPRVDPRDIDEVIEATSHITPQPPAASPFQVFPNPFRHETRVVLSLPGDTRADVAVYDVLGKKVLDIATGGGPRAEFLWDGTDADGQRLPAGVYLVRFKTGDLEFTRKVMLLR